METNGQASTDNQGTYADLPRIEAAIAHDARLLWDIQRVRMATNNRIKAILRDGLPEPWTNLHTATLDLLQDQERTIERTMHHLVKQHIMADWIDDCPGLGYGGFARIVGVTGSFLNFPNVYKVYKYMGLHVVNGRRPRRERGVAMVKTTEEAEGTAFSPQGQVVAHQLGEVIAKDSRCRHCEAKLVLDGGVLVAVGRKDGKETRELSDAAKACQEHRYGKYRERYGTRRVQTFARPRRGSSGCPMGHEHKKDGKIYPCISQNGDGEKSAHLHNDAMRIAVKKLIKDLYLEWHRRASGLLTPTGGMPADATLAVGVA